MRKNYIHTIKVVVKHRCQRLEIDKKACQGFIMDGWILKQLGTYINTDEMKCGTEESHYYNVVGHCRQNWSHLCFRYTLIILFPRIRQLCQCSNIFLVFCLLYDFVYYNFELKNILPLHV